MEKSSYEHEHPAPPPSYIGNDIVTTTVTGVVPQAIIINQAVGPTPTRLTCPACRETMVSRLEYETSTKTHLMAALICLLGGVFCCCIPYCVNNCMNANHYCSKCGAFVGTYAS